jgi:glycosyltransferase involved in cell wall biosynthesis
VMQMADRPLRIAMLAPSPDVHGPVGKHTRHLVAALEDEGCGVALVTWGRTSDQHRPPARALQRFADVLKVRRLIRGERFEVLVVKTAHDWNTLSRDLLLLGLVRPRPATILQFHGSAVESFDQRGHAVFTKASRLLARRVQGIMVLSSQEKRAWQQLAPDVPVMVVRNPYLRRKEAVAPPAHGSRPLKLLFAGRLIEEKGAAEVLLAASRMREPPEVMIAGDGPDRSRLEALASRLSVSTRFLGQLDADGMAEAYRSADVFVLPTRWAEGFPTVISEAMDFGLPIVTTCNRGMADHLAEGTNALFCDPQDPGTLVAALDKMASGPQLRLAMGTANREAVARFEPGAVARDYLADIRTVLAQGRS